MMDRAARIVDPFHIALVGAPISGKTSLFNALTGSRQKIGNFLGVTVERKVGTFVTSSGRTVSLVDLPGAYSLRGRSPEEITRDVVLGRFSNEAMPDLVLCIADATNLRLTFRLVLELSQRAGIGDVRPLCCGDRQRTWRFLRYQVLHVAGLPAGAFHA